MSSGVCKSQLESPLAATTEPTSNNLRAHALPWRILYAATKTWCSQLINQKKITPDFVWWEFRQGRVGMVCLCSMLSGTMAGNPWRQNITQKLGASLTWKHLQLTCLETELGWLRGKVCWLEHLQMVSSCNPGVPHSMAASGESDSLCHDQLVGLLWPSVGSHTLLLPYLIGWNSHMPTQIEEAGHRWPPLSGEMSKNLQTMC